MVATFSVFQSSWIRWRVNENWTHWSYIYDLNVVHYFWHSSPEENLWFLVENHLMLNFVFLILWFNYKFIIVNCSMLSALWFLKNSQFCLKKCITLILSPCSSFRSLKNGKIEDKFVDKTQPPTMYIKKKRRKPEFNSVHEEVWPSWNRNALSPRLDKSFHGSGRAHLHPKQVTIPYKSEIELHLWSRVGWNIYGGPSPFYKMTFRTEVKESGASVCIYTGTVYNLPC